jgi:hypothetical protein
MKTPRNESESEILYIAHRINTLEQFGDSFNCDSGCGIECDFRDYKDDVVVQHDPFKDGVPMKTFFKYVSANKPALVIVNVKTEGIEEHVLRELPEQTPYFFLDCTFPMVYKLSESGNTNIALRFSEFERMDQLRAMAGRAQWVWVDTFHSFHLKKAEVVEMKELGYKVCLVSPELQGRDANVAIPEYAEYLKREGCVEFVDAICTKHYNISFWKTALAI